MSTPLAVVQEKSGSETKSEYKKNGNKSHSGQLTMDKNENEKRDRNYLSTKGFACKNQHKIMKKGKHATHTDRKTAENMNKIKMRDGGGEEGEMSIFGG